ncbi:uncharacterized protein L201_007888 [Kwoniella dendrophila CBS 6074]|uniref:ATP-dependent DNA ligase family profile domain-containing protein n=1 Tax=Kwoniella dendrophila CBS 6074 TaxID=1295534 RepID=A0AAX4K7T3_9TREE
MDIPFESYAKLVYHLGNPPKSAQTSTKVAKALPPSKIFQSWLNHLPKPFPPGTGKHIFRLLFPHEGSRRRYGLKENKLATELERILGLKGLLKWDCVSWDNSDSGTGCLGKEVEISLRNKSISDRKSTVSIKEIDNLLDELAASSSFSQLSQNPPNFKSPQVILTTLYRESNLSPFSISVLTQIILRDLRPLLNPLPRLPVRNPTTMLRMKTNTGPDQLTLRDAMLVWDKRMWEFYIGGRGDLDKCADLVEKLDQQNWEEIVMTGPVIGTNVKIPKCKKGRSIADALSEFTGTKYAHPANEIWAETKYDGYRMQIHVDYTSDEPRITVFSKSTRNSTIDRMNAHSIILASLNIPIPTDLPMHPALLRRLKSMTETPGSKQPSTVILEAEVVPYNESSREGSRGPGIEEFWWLGLAGVTASATPLEPDFGLPKQRNRHLFLVFFDILFLNGQNLLHRRYEERRALLEETIRPIHGFSQLAERTKINLSANRNAALESLEKAFQLSSDRREEGLVLKASNSTYTNMRWQWVKLKKDYIPNLGDCIDLILLGAGWDIDRARDLRVDTSVFTTFYLGVLTNSSRVTSHRELPHFEILFRVSYGPDRIQLEYYNECLRHGRWGSKPFDKDDPFKRRLIGLSWTYTLQKGMTPPSVMFEKPLCAEVMGAGFQKLPGSELYELRWPRLQKIYEPSERGWVDALSSQGLIITAHQSLGYNVPLNSPYSPPSGEDSIRALWRSHSTVNLIDVPVLVSPKSPISPKRVKSEPNLVQFFRDSSPTPNPSGRPKDSGKQLQTAKKLTELIADDGGLFDSNQPLIPDHLRPQITSPSHITRPSPIPTISSATVPQEIPRPSGSPSNIIAFGPLLPIPLVQTSPRKSPQRNAIRPTSPVKRLILSIDWSRIDIRDQSTPIKKKQKTEDLKETKETIKRSSILKPLSLRSRMKLASRRIGVKS